MADQQTYAKTSDSLALLLTYLSLIGIWFAIPSVTLLINKDSRWPWALAILAGIVLMLVISYIFQWRFLFPLSSTQIVFEKNQQEEKLRDKANQERGRRIEAEQRENQEELEKDEALEHNTAKEIEDIEAKRIKKDSKKKEK